ncbi:MAG: ribbon-helix-helix protein, CopG family [Burkholderiales bacterium]|nr:ribbon-helix-helix protein, CopG family [Burkholderiales bacterium]
MRTTLTLDDDVAAKLKLLARRTARPFREVVNEALRRGLAAEPRRPPPEPFRVRTRDMGELRPGLSLENIGELLDRIEGPLYR